jgi:8-hydroxy-5-deazaflavin:NADPH oxidoreductase
VPYTIALIGGTGAEGRGLATRFALAGHRVIIGSRDAARAAGAAAEIAKLLTTAARPGSPQLAGADNLDAASQADVAVIVLPYEAHGTTLASLAGALAGKVVVDAVAPVRFERGPRPIDVPEGSAAQQAAVLLPGSRVIGAFQTVAATTLQDPDAPIDEDVLLTGDDAEAKALVRTLVEGIVGARAVDAGPLRYSRFVEGITVLLIGINGRYKAHSGIRVVGLPA